MMRVNIQELKSRVRIEKIIAEYVSLEQTSNNMYRSCCPFHSETKPSFTVYTETQSFFCFGCGAGGDVIAFIMKIEGIGFREAIKKLGNMI